MAGFNINNLVENRFKDYDHNGNGLIEYKSTAKNSEAYRQDERKHYNNDNTYTTEKITLSNRKLFTDADNNKDGFVSKTELKNFVSKFDLNKNGKLDLRSFEEWLNNDNKPKAEYKSFSRNYHETEVKRK